MDLISKKSGLAKLLATENITIENKNVKSAKFDVANRVLTLPNFENMDESLLDMFVGHEVGHALFTPYSKSAQKKFEATPGLLRYTNAAEDARIERKIQAMYPGLKRQFNKAYEELIINRDWFDLKGKDLSKIKLIDRINLHFKRVPNVPFSEEEQKFVDEIENTETFTDSVDVAERLYTYCKEVEEDKQKQEGDGEGEKSDEPPTGDEEQRQSKSNADGQGDQEQEQRGDGEGDDDDDGEEEEDGAGDEEKDGGKEEQKKDGGKEEQKKKSMASKGAGKDIESAIAPDLDVDNDNFFKDMIDESGKENVYLTMAESNLDKIIVSYKDVEANLVKHFSNRRTTEKNKFWVNRSENLRIFKKANSRIIGFMVKEFMMKKAADDFKKQQTSKTGVIDFNKLKEYRTSEDIFKRNLIVKEGKNHGMLMFVDWSGSMCDCFGGIMEQVINLVMFCRQVNIPFDVYGFNDNHVRNNWIKKANTFYTDGCNLRNYLSSKMNNAEYTRGLENFLALKFNLQRDRTDYREQSEPPYEGFSGTPLNDAIIHAQKISEIFRKENGLQIVNCIFLTDGDSNSSGYYQDKEGRTQSAIGYGKNYIVTDPKSKIQYQHCTRTETLLKMLAETQDVNVIGFYISDYQYQQYRASKKDRFALVKQKGYDSYFIIPSKGVSTVKGNMFEGMDVNDKKFDKHVKSKREEQKNERVMVSKLMELMGKNR